MLKIKLSDNTRLIIPFPSTITYIYSLFSLLSSFHLVINSVNVVIVQGVRGQALTHTSNEDKTKLSIVWQAPRVPQGHVVFRYANVCIVFNKPGNCSIMYFTIITDFLKTVL